MELLPPFDLIYIAPPQYEELWSKAITLIDADLDSWLARDGAIIVQIHPAEYEELSLRQLVLYDQRKYGSTLLCFYERHVA